MGRRKPGQFPNQTQPRANIPATVPHPKSGKFPGDAPSSHVGQTSQRWSIIPYKAVNPHDGLQSQTCVPSTRRSALTRATAFSPQHAYHQPGAQRRPVRWATFPTVCTINPALSIDPCDGLKSPTHVPSTQRLTLTRTMGHIPKRVYINPALSVDPCYGLQSPTHVPSTQRSTLTRTMGYSPKRVYRQPAAQR